MSTKGPLMRIHQHPYLEDRMDDAQTSVTVTSDRHGVSIEIEIDLPDETIHVYKTGPDYGIALDVALQELYEILNDRQWPPDPARDHRERMDSIAADNPSLTRRTS